MEFSKNVKSLQFILLQCSLKLNITFLGEKLWPVTWNQKFTITSVKIKISKEKKKKKLKETSCSWQSDYCGHPFRVSGFFLQPIIKDRPNILYQDHYFHLQDLFLMNFRILQWRSFLHNFFLNEICHYEKTQRWTVLKYLYEWNAFLFCRYSEFTFCLTCSVSWGYWALKIFWHSCSGLDRKHKNP